MGPSPEVVDAVIRRIEADEIVAFLAQGRACGWCRHPVRLEGKRVAVEDQSDKRTTVFDSAECPDGVVLKACGNPRETRCPSCAALYREDARHLVKAGLEGGKGAPASFREHPAILLTLTAPSFGAVHVAKPGRAGPGTRGGAVLMAGRSPASPATTTPRRHRDTDLPGLLPLRRGRAPQRRRPRAVAEDLDLHPEETGGDLRAHPARVPAPLPGVVSAGG
jgi:hypothetical protein